MSRRLISVAALAALPALASCSVNAWNDFESGSTVKTIRSTKPFPERTFGILLASQQVTTADHAFSRLLVGTGHITRDEGISEGIFGSYSFWEDDHLELGTKIYAACDGPDPGCPDDAGTSIIPVSDLRGGSGCMLASAPIAASPQVVLTCESSDSTEGRMLSSIASPAAANARFGQGLAPIGADASSLGSAIASAPGANELYVLDPQTTFALLPLNGHTPAAGDRFGETIATAPIRPTDPAVVAKLPPSMASSFLAVSSPVQDRVYLFVSRLVTSTERDALLVGCIDGPRVDATTDDGFGTVLVAGDLTGDGMPELVLGANLEATEREDLVRIVSLADLDFTGGVAAGCADPSPSDDPPTRTLWCAAGGDRGIGCEAFGASIAIGNADGTPEHDLLVGAPLAVVSGVSHAGAAYVYAGNASLDVLVSDTNEPSRLVDSSPEVNDTLGLAVTFVASQFDPGTPRDEIVVSVPGASRLFAFLCSGLPGDALTDDPILCSLETSLP